MKVDSTTSTTIKVLSASTLDIFSTKYDGGIYISSPIATLEIKNSNVNSASAKNGAIYFTSPTVTSVTLTVDTSIFNVLSSTHKGTFIYLDGTGSPIIAMTISHSEYYCQS